MVTQNDFYFFSLIEHTNNINQIFVRLILNLLCKYSDIFF